MPDAVMPSLSCPVPGAVRLVLKGGTWRADRSSMSLFHRTRETEPGDVTEAAAERPEGQTEAPAVEPGHPDRGPVLYDQDA